MVKYDRLKKFLSLHRDKKITLTLEQIELIINSKLPPTARLNNSFWQYTPSNPSAKSISDAGWKASLSTEKGKIAYLTLEKK